MPVFIEDLIAEFHRTYADKLIEIRLCCTSQARTQLIPLVHYVKGSLGNLGLARASAYAGQAELELRTEKFSRYQTFAEQLDKHTAQGLRELKKRYR